MAPFYFAMNDKLKAQLLKDIEELELTEYQEQILQELKPAIHIQLQSKKEVPIGRSKFGGKPDVPPDFVYPTYGDGKPQTFLAQLRLEDLTAFPIAKDLPPKGMLYFFHLEHPEMEDVEDSFRLLSWQCEWEDWAVIHWDGDPALLRPSEQRTYYTYPEAEIRFEERLSGNLTELDVDYPVFSRLEKLESKHCIGLGHQLLGKPTPQQPWCFVDEEKVDEMILLLQLDHEPELNMEWGDAGTLYFLIDPTDLKKQDFSKCQYEYQMG